MITKTLTKLLKQALNKRHEVAFAYLHGSALSSGNPRDLDVAAFLFPLRFEKLDCDGEVNIGFAIPLEMELEGILGEKVDFQVLNGAPLSFRHRVVSAGLLVIDKDSSLRSDFEYLSRVEYFDFRPRRQEYLKEVMTS
jgi:predicted nucleotidyltransferase